MAIAFRDANNAGNASGGNLTITKPTGTADGDILVVVLYREASSGWTLPGGWSQVVERAVGTTLWLTVAWKRASSEGANYTFNLATTFRAGVMAAFSGCLASGDVIDVSTSNDDAGGGGRAVASSVTTTADGHMEIAGIGNYDGNVLSYYSGTSLTLPTDGHLGTVDLWYGVKATAGATGSTTFDPVAGTWATITIALKIASSVVDATVTAVAATCAAAGVVPALSTGSTVTAVVAGAPAAGVVASISTDSAIVAVVATCAAAGIAPDVSAGVNATVTAVSAESAAAGIAPAIAVDYAVTAAIGTASAAGVAPDVTVGVSVDVAAVAATCAAAGVAPTLSTGSAIAAVAATCAAAALAPTMSGTAHNVDIGNGYSDVTPRQLVRTSDDRVWASSWRFETYPHGGIGGGNYNSQTLRMYKAGQTGTPTSFSRMDSANEPAGVVSWSMAVDQNDVIHVLWTVRATWGAYGTDNYLRYCQFNTANGTWGTVEDVETTMATQEGGQNDELVAIAIDHSNVPHIVYLKHDGTRRRVTYRNRSGGTWGSATTVDDQSFGSQEQCWHPGIVFDYADRLVITWMRGAQDGTTAGRAFIRVYSSGSWGTTVDVTGANLWTGIDTGTPVYVDTSGRYHICFLSTGKAVRYYYSDDQGATWSANNPGSGTYTGDDPTPAPAPNGKVRIYMHSNDVTPHISYFEGDGGSATWGSEVDYITQTPYDCSVNVRWSRHWWWYPSRFDVIYWKNTYAPDANELYFGTDIGGTDALVRSAIGTANAAAGVPVVTNVAEVVAVTGTASGAGLAPALATSSAITAVTAPAGATAIAPSVSAGNSVEISAEIALASAAGQVPNVAASGNISAEIATAIAAAIAPALATSSTIPAVVATATASAIAPSVSTTAETLIASVVATATAAFNAPALTTNSNLTVVTATATAAFNAPIIGVMGNVTLESVVAPATAAALAPLIDAGNVAVLALMMAAAAAFNAPYIMTASHGGGLGGHPAPGNRPRSQARGARPIYRERRRG